MRGWWSVVSIVVAACGGGVSVDSVAKTAPPETTATVDGLDCTRTTAAAPAYLARGTVTLAFASNLPASNKLLCSLDGATAAPCVSPQKLTASNDVVHDFEVESVRSNGTVGAPVDCFFEIDTTAPTITFAASACQAASADALYAPTGTIAFTLGDSESGVASATCSVDGAPAVACLDNPSHGSFAFIGLAAGAHALAVTVIDATGNARTAMLTFVVDATPPVVTFVAPTDPTPFVLGEEQFTIFANIVASGTLIGTFTGTGDAYTCQVDGGPATSCTGQYDVSALAEGQHQVTIAATDCVGNVGTSQLTFWVDANAPAPLYDPFVTTTDTSATVTLSFVDTTNIDSVACLLDHDVDGLNPDLDASVVPVSPCPGLDGLPALPDGDVPHPRRFDGTIQLDELAPGAHTLWIVARDFWGHRSNMQRVSFTVTATHPDGLPPVGHIVVIGHDYDTVTSDTGTLVGNAVGLAPGRAYNRVLRVLALDAGAAGADGTLTDNVLAAINQRLRALGETGCPADPTQRCFDVATWAGNPDSPDEDLGPNLLGRDVLLVYDQNDSSTSARIGAKSAWRAEVQAFAAAGGIVIVLDGLAADSTPSQTVSILGGTDPATSLLATGADGASSGPVSTGCCTDNPLLSDVASSYTAPANTVTFAPVAGVKSVLVAPFGNGDHPVVLDRGF